MPLSVEYLVGQPAVSIDADSPQWSAPLPLQRQVLLRRQAPKPSGKSVTYGDYFTAVRNYLTGQGMPGLARLAASAAGHTVESGEIQRLTVHLIKHGAFYHPSLVILHTRSQDLPLILNVAVSHAGREVLQDEHRYLELLARRFPQTFIPKVFGCGRGVDAAGRQMEMFAAQWLPDFHELHPSKGPAADRVWTVWDMAQGPRRLTRSQVSAYHQQAAFILTYYYNPLTFEAILDWHLEAGDFVIRQDEAAISVCLITVRRYAPMFVLGADTSIDLRAVLDGLVVFFLNTSLSLRMDRLDGVGELVWAPDSILPDVWQGFRRGLECLAPLYDLPPEFIQGAQHYLAAHGQEGLIRVTRQVIEDHDRQDDARALLHRHGSEHAAKLTRIIRDTV